jgi:hypothetical protein
LPVVIVRGRKKEKAYKETKRRKKRKKERKRKVERKDLQEKKIFSRHGRLFAVMSCLLSYVCMLSKWEILGGKWSWVEK